MKIVSSKIIYCKHVIFCIYTLTTFFLMIMFESCSNSSQKQSQYSNKNIKPFLSSKPINIQEEYIIQDSTLKYDTFSFFQKELPIELKGCEYEESNYPNKEHFYRNGTEYIAYCSFNINKNIYALISLGIADCYIPIISTYIKDSIIDMKEVNIGFGDLYCGETTGDYLRIDTNYNIYVSDTITEYICESLDSIKVKRIKYVLYKVGYISFDGQITISDTMRKKID